MILSRKKLIFESIESTIVNVYYLQPVIMSTKVLDEEGLIHDLKKRENLSNFEKEGLISDLEKRGKFLCSYDKKRILLLLQNYRHLQEGSVTYKTCLRRFNEILSLLMTYIEILDTTDSKTLSKEMYISLKTPEIVSLTGITQVIANYNLLMKVSSHASQIDIQNFKKQIC